MKSWSIPENLIDKPFLSPKELKDILGVSILTVYRLVESGKLPVFKIGKSLRFNREDIISFLKAQRIGQVR